MIVFAEVYFAHFVVSKVCLDLLSVIVLKIHRKTYSADARKSVRLFLRQSPWHKVTPLHNQARGRTQFQAMIVISVKVHEELTAGDYPLFMVKHWLADTPATIIVYSIAQ